MRGKFLVPPSMREIKQQTVKDMKKISNHIKKNYDPRDPLFTKDDVEGRSVNNLWTGYKLGGKGKIAVAGSMLGGGTIIAANPRNLQDSYNRGVGVEAESEALDIESMQSTRGDGLGYKMDLSTSALQSMSASGDLVFAMHKTRHSGQL